MKFMMKLLSRVGTSLNAAAAEMNMSLEMNPKPFVKRV